VEIGPLYNGDLGPLFLEIFERPEDIEKSVGGRRPRVIERTVKFGHGEPRMINNVVAYVTLQIPYANKCTLFRGNIRIDIFCNVNNENKEKKLLMSFWLNTFLLKLPRRGQMFRLEKLEIDKVQKDVDHTRFPEDFAICLKIRNTNRSSVMYSSVKKSEKNSRRRVT